MELSLDIKQQHMFSKMLRRMLAQINWVLQKDNRCKNSQNNIKEEIMKF